MSNIAFITDHLDYLQRNDAMNLKPPDRASKTAAPPELRSLYHITGIGCFDKNMSARQMNDQYTLNKDESPAWLTSNDALIGLYGYKLPAAFLVWGEEDGTTIHFGSWSPVWENASPKKLEARRSIVGTVLKSVFPSIQLKAVPEKMMARPPLAGLVLGIPTIKPPNLFNGYFPMDRLIHAMRGANWACLVLAEPVDESTIISQQQHLINEQRETETSAKVSDIPTPLANYYVDLLKVETNRLKIARAVGGWRTAVYLMGDDNSYYRLVSVWRGIFSGDKSLPEPLSIIDSPNAAQLAVSWSMPDESDGQVPAECKYHRPFKFQTLLNTNELAAYIHLPRLETGGFTVSIIPDFDAVPPHPKDEKNIQIGTVIHKGELTKTGYEVTPASLTRHVFIPGVTGSGKTNTVKHLLQMTSKLNIPYLVIEPAKKEYRSLMGDRDLFGDPKVFTLGDEQSAKFRINPFEVEKWPHTSISTHIDMLKSVFGASFGMWTPLPQVLEECIHKIYRDRGWDTVTNQNHRLSDPANVSAAFPTLTDLANKIEAVTRELGFDQEAEERVRASLLTRINSLRIGGKGCMLDVQQSLPMETLLSNSVILELEGMGDDDDKAFLMGLILIKLAEYRRQQPKKKGLRHLLVFEEAHRLLSNVPAQTNEEQSNPRGKAVEAFTNMLSEIRAYGQGVIIADQVPVKLAPDVIKNTNLKIAHRVLASDDRQVLAGSMSMDEKQARALSILAIRKEEGVSEAIVFSEGDDIPIMTGVPKITGGESEIENETVKKTWEKFNADHNLDSIYRTYPTCDKFCKKHNPACTSARLISEIPQIQTYITKFILSLVTTISDTSTKKSDYAGVMKELIQSLEQTVQPYMIRLQNTMENMNCVMTHGIYYYMEQVGSFGNWSFSQTQQLIDLLLPVTAAVISKKRELSPDLITNLNQFCTEYIQLNNCTGPFYGCKKACKDTCLFRHAIEPFAQNTELQENFRTQAESDNYTENIGSQCEYVLDQILLTMVPDKFINRVASCFVIQQTTAWQDYGQVRQHNLIDEFLDLYQIEEGGE